MTPVRVQFGVQEDARRVIFDVLDKVNELTARQKARLASELTATLRDGDCLARAVEQHYNATDTATLIGRCAKYVVGEFKSGQYGPVFRDDGGWLYPASTIQRWLDARVFCGSATGQKEEKAA